MSTRSIYEPRSVGSLDTLKRKKEWDKERKKRWKGRGDSGRDISMDESIQIDDAHRKDVNLKTEYGIDAPKARSFGIDPTKAKDMNLSGELDMTNEELRKKFGKKAGGKIKKSKKVRGAGIAKRGVRPAKMR